MLLALPVLFLCLPVTGQNKSAKNNLTIKEWNVEVSTGAQTLDHETIYDAQGRKISESEYGKDGIKWKKKYEYAADGTLSRVLVYTASGKLDNVRKFDFDALGRKKKEYIYNSKGKLSKYKVYEYSTSSASNNK